MTREEVLLDVAERCGIDIDGCENVIVYDRDKMAKFKKWLFEELKNADEELPSVTPTRKKGFWTMTNDYITTAYGTIDYVKCSCCGEECLEEGNYCPNCGSLMSEEV